MLKKIIIVLAVLLVLTLLELVWFVGRGIKNSINETHSWEENPDKAESEARNEREA